jgi:hypothetical protein
MKWSSTLLACTFLASALLTLHARPDEQENAPPSLERSLVVSGQGSTLSQPASKGRAMCDQTDIQRQLILEGFVRAAAVRPNPLR